MVEEGEPEEAIHAHATVWADRLVYIETLCLYSCSWYNRYAHGRMTTR